MEKEKDKEQEEEEEEEEKDSEEEKEEVKEEEEDAEEVHYCYACLSSDPVGKSIFVGGRGGLLLRCLHSCCR